MTFSSHSKSRVLQLRTKLHASQRSTLSVQEYIQSIKIIADKLAATGHPDDDQELIIIVLRGLGPSYEALTASLTTHIELLTLQDVLAYLIAHETIMT